MTCVVGVVEKGVVYLGADSIAVGGYDMVTRDSPKLFPVGPFGIGVAGSIRAADVIRYKFQPPEPTPSQGVHEYMCTSFVDALRTVLKDNGVVSVRGTVEEITAYSALLVGFRGCLFEMFDDFQVGVNSYPYGAVGCGAPIAMGALHATPHETPRTRVRKALEAAQAFNAGVRSPWRTLVVK